ncbi:MAG: hypothetical protein HY796_06790 [Elusimicrobia bacterium]|nr:hypothetical protein [Elusimicrobiota bacterium]
MRFHAFLRAQVKLGVILDWDNFTNLLDKAKAIIDPDYTWNDAKLNNWIDDYKNGIPFEKLNPEAQAEAMRFYYKVGQYDIHGAEPYTDYLNKALDYIRNKKKVKSNSTAALYQ